MDFLVENPDSLMTDSDILEFINKFKSNDPSGSTIALFSKSLSMDFAFILWRRTPESAICLIRDENENIGYAMEHSGKYYSINGEITPKRVISELCAGAMF